MPVLTVIDASGIQKYIFGSNRLKEIIGASEIVNRATTEWIFKLLGDDAINGKKIETDNTDAELIYAGGGNALIVFADIDKAKDFTKKYTRQILTEARGLEVVIAHSSVFEIDASTSILDKHGEVLDKLNEKKANRQTSSPLRGLAVTAQCASTGGVATEPDELRKKYISTESKQKQDAADEANKRLEREIFQNLPDVSWKKSGLKIPFDFDYLGRTHGEASFIAVVHTDGNAMGERVERAGKGANNRDCIDKMRNFSTEIQESNLKALRAAISLLWKHIDKAKKEFSDRFGESFVLTESYFPVRPLIFGGDDLTFVCDGRIALALTAIYLKELQKIILNDGDPIYARAGISIVKTHYPFSRAYQLAEELASSAKEIINEVDQGEKKVAAIDWHVAMSGLLGDLNEIREREYTAAEGKLNMRPVLVSAAKPYNKWRTWENFESIISDFQGYSASKENWREKRNKVKFLREILRKGADETRSFIANVQKLPNLKNGSDIEKSGWEGGRCGYFDEIEMLDLFYHLDETSAKNREVKSNE